MKSERAVPQLYYLGEPLDMSPQCFGELKVSTDALDNRDELRRRMATDGYLFVPGYLDRDQVIEARLGLLQQLADNGSLNPDHPLSEGILKPSASMNFSPELAASNPSLDRVLYSGHMIQFFEHFLGGEVAHFDYTWFRTKAPGTKTATHPHCDIVYMGRGTHNLYTAWVPFSDVPYKMGGLIVLENSHLNDELRATYGQRDVDSYCEDDDEAVKTVERVLTEGRELSDEERSVVSATWGGHYSPHAIATREDLGGRWLTAEYRMGDLLVFCMNLMHSSSDNQTDRVRLSSDSRYQLASEPQDGRWIGEDPPMHGIRAKEGMIC
jgi:hypothetical protein